MVEIKRMLNAEKRKFRELEASTKEFKDNYEKLQEDIYK